ncbi:hypothetical protein MTR67_030740 [Solanum verrucosum]|uniref:Reverse transcriptase domain-containing protein n=1 Tax=Solanum verrucosum TaxID=315347 RepID=A0AAF0ZEV3_SOLVR|nr:hypothetical protein MTR67_030740 [Solanum verrucosum]
MQIVQLSFADDLLLFSRGDTISVRLMFDIFQEFSLASGLVANADKSSIYFGGAPTSIQNEILHDLGFSQGYLPFRYLGVPLSTKRVSILQYQPLIDKIMSRIQRWTFRFLSYAGRTQLIKSVLFSIQVIWSQVFVLPKKVVKCIATLCRTFLWTRGVDASRKALIAWEHLCSPKIVGDLNILNIQAWNKAAISKLLWNLSTKKDRLWVKWIHMYYGKQGTIWGVIPTQASWTVKKIMQMHKVFETIGWNEEYVKHIGKFSIKQLYKAIRGEYQKVEWRRFTCNNIACPKWIFILYLALHSRLLTRDRLATWGCVEDIQCVLCRNEDENHNHLFFRCLFSSQVWQKIPRWQNINRKAKGWEEETSWANTYCKGKQAKAEVYRITLAASVYLIWQERNQRIFQKTAKTPAMLAK